MTGPLADSTPIPSILAQFLHDAERLIKVANESVGSFFVSEDVYERSGKNFVGFLQDSLVGDQDFRISTGGLSVTDSLYQAEPYLEYLDSNGITTADELRKRRGESRKYVMEMAHPTSFAASVSFQTLSPLTYSMCASIGNVAENDKSAHARAMFFNMINLSYFLGDGWPLLKNVDKPHPFVAFKVQKAISGLIRNSNSGVKSILQSEDDFLSKAFTEYGVTEPDTNIVDAIKTLRRNSPDEAIRKIRTAHSQFRRQAEHYLWEQIGYAPSKDAVTESSLLYDPVGAAYALNILLNSTVGESAEGDAQKVLGEHISLIARSIDHILAALTSTGLFPYGVPFSYNTNGTAGFTTSINGLSALTRFLVKLLRRARELNYPSEQFFEHLLTTNFQRLERLFSLAPFFSNTRRSSEISKGQFGFLKQDINLLGWSTDRAPNNSRIESWVTIEVLLFGVYLREALQEFAQFIVCRKYRARKPLPSEPLWPYRGTTTITMTDNPDGASFVDPDRQDVDDYSKAKHGAGSKEIVFQDSGNCPVQFLHINFGQFLTDSSLTHAQTWKQEVSSVLLFGPPGTAKSTTAVSLARALGWHYLELSPSNFIIDGLETIEQKAKEIFEELGMLRETVILFDELDSLFIDREILEPDSIINFLVPAMLPKIQTLSKKAKTQRVLIVIATNFYDRLDPAMVRRGRIDRHLLVLPYNDNGRTHHLSLMLKSVSDVMESKVFVQEFRTHTRLYVFEELKDLSRKIRERAEKVTDKRSFEFHDYSPSAINPSIYSSRLQRDGNASAPRARSTQRLALEISEVAGRLLNENRNLNDLSDLNSMLKRLEELQTKLTAAGESEWGELCRQVGNQLKSVQLSPTVTKGLKP